MHKLSREKTGELMIFGETMMYSFFPIIVAYTTKIMPPILFAGLSALTASVTLFLFLLFKKNLDGLKNPDTLKNSLGVTLFIVIIPSILIFSGSSLTSGINTTILLQAEIFFTFLLYGIFRVEKITRKKIFGAAIVLAGTILIIYNGTTAVNIGDLLIIAGTAFYPVGNWFAKRALKTATPSTILFIRSLLGGIILVVVSLLFENQSGTTDKIYSYWPLILLNGVIIYHLSKILWYEGIKRIDVSKAIPISTGGYPAFSLIFAMIFLKEIPTAYQIVGFAIVAVGIFTLLRKDRGIQPVGTQ